MNGLDKTSLVMGSWMVKMNLILEMSWGLGLV